MCNKHMLANAQPTLIVLQVMTLAMLVGRKHVDVC